MRDNRSSLQACTPKARVATCRPTAKPEKSKFYLWTWGGGGGGGGGGRETGKFRERGRGAVTHAELRQGEEGARTAVHSGGTGAVCSALREPRKVDCFFYFGDGVGRLFAVVFVVPVKKVERSALLRNLLLLSCGIEGFLFRQHKLRVLTFFIYFKFLSVQLNVAFNFSFLTFYCDCLSSSFFS